MLLHKNLHEMQFFCAKDQKVPCCRRRIGISLGETSGLHINCVTPVTQGLGLIRNDTELGIVDTLATTRVARIFLFAG
ncbi:MAG: hypothetical protein ACLFVO_21135, partial [Chloroflexaceae bacterium]